MTTIATALQLACFTCMQTSDKSINEATSQSILTMLIVMSIPMLGCLGLVTKIVVRTRKANRQD